MKKLLTKIVATSLVSTMVLSGCSSEKVVEKQDITLVALAASAQQAEVISSQLSSANFNVNLITTVDYSTHVTELAKGEYDIALSGWTTVTGNPDYAVMSIFHTNGDYNTNGLSNSDLDKNLEIGQSARIGSDEFLNAYYEVEKILNENAYIVPLTYTLRTYAIGKSLDEDTVVVNKSRSMKFEDYSFASDSGKDNEVDPLKFAHNTISLTSLDPMKANDGTVFALNTNQYARLVNLGPKDNIEPGIAIAYESEDQQNFYFALRDDAYFSNGDKLTADDVIFSLQRASNKDVEGNKVFTIQGNIENINKVSTEEIPPSILTTLKSNGATDELEYVHITTHKPYGQLYNMLAHTSGGIVSKSAIESAGSDYGTLSNLDNLVVSGPYIVKEVNPTTNEIILGHNEYYYGDINIKNIIFKVIPEVATSVNALQTGEVDFLYNITSEQYPVIEGADNTTLLKADSNGFSYIEFNMNEGSRASDVNFRKAVYNAIDPEVFLQVTQNGYGGVGASTLYPVLKDTTPTGYEKPTNDISKVEEFLNLYKNK